MPSDAWYIFVDIHEVLINAAWTSGHEASMFAALRLQDKVPSIEDAVDDGLDVCGFYRTDIVSSSGFSVSEPG